MLTAVEMSNTTSMAPGSSCSGRERQTLVGRAGKSPGKCEGGGGGVGALLVAVDPEWLSWLLQCRTLQKATGPQVLREESAQKGGKGNNWTFKIQCFCCPFTAEGDLS